MGIEIEPGEIDSCRPNPACKKINPNLAKLPMSIRDL
jgi:hypothetical protein